MLKYFQGIEQNISMKETVTSASLHLNLYVLAFGHFENLYGRILVYSLIIFLKLGKCICTTIFRKGPKKLLLLLLLLVQTLSIHCWM